MAALRLSDTDRSRREKLVGMLGSSFDGERLNALGHTPKDGRRLQNADPRISARQRERRDRVRASTDSGPNKRSAERVKLSCGRSGPNKPRRGETHTSCRACIRTRRNSPPDWRDRFKEAQQLNRSRCFLTAWETNFVADLIDRGTRWPSPKQAVVIDPHSRKSRRVQRSERRRR